MTRDFLFTFFANRNGASFYMNMRITVCGKLTKEVCDKMLDEIKEKDGLDQLPTITFIKELER